MRWNPFKRRGGESAPAPAGPTPAPSAPAPADEPRGLLGRIAGRLRRKPAAPEEPRTPRPERRRGVVPPPPPPAPEPSAPPAPPTPAGPPAGGAGGAEAEGGPARQYPGSLKVSASGNWQISSTEWDGVMSGHLYGNDVRAFIDAMEGHDFETAVTMIAHAFDGKVGGQINPHESEIYRIDY